MSTALMPYMPTIDPEAINRALMAGDLSKLSPGDRTHYYLALCTSNRLNPLTRPFILLKSQDGSLQWYATVGCTEQLRRRDHVSMRVLSREQTPDGMYVITVQASTPDGRVEESQGVVTLAEPRMTWKKTADGKNYQAEDRTSSGDPILVPLHGKARENAMMRAESKAKRRATLALCGLGLPAEDEGGRAVSVDPLTGEIVGTDEPGLIEASGDEPIGHEAAQQHIADMFDRSTGAPAQEEREHA